MSVADEDVAAGEAQRGAGDAVVDPQEKESGDLQRASDGANGQLALLRVAGRPVLEVVGLVVPVQRLGSVPVEQREGVARRSDANRLVPSIQHEDGHVEHVLPAQEWVRHRHSLPRLPPTGTSAQ